MTVRDLATSSIPYYNRVFEVDVDFIDHTLLICVSDGAVWRLLLELQSAADFFDHVSSALAKRNLKVRIRGAPHGFPGALPSKKDLAHRTYDPG